MSFTIKEEDALKEYYEKLRQKKVDFNKFKKKLRLTNYTIDKKRVLLEDKERSLEKKYGVFTKSKDNYSVTVKSKTLTINRPNFIIDSDEQDKLYSDINELATKIIINTLDNSFKYEEDENLTFNNYDNLYKELEEKNNMKSDLIQKINDKKNEKNTKLDMYYDKLNEITVSIKEELMVDNVSSEKYQNVAAIYKSLIPLIRNIQELKNMEPIN